MGKKKQPFYRIVAVDSRAKRDGKYLEKIGHYNPMPDPADIELDKEKTFKWLDRGAIPTDTVKSFLRKKGMLMEWDLKRKGFDDERIAQELKKYEVLMLERAKRLEAKAAMEKREEVKEEKQPESEPVIDQEEAKEENTEATE